MVDRLIIAATLIGLATGAYVVGTRWQVNRISHRDDSDPVLARIQIGIPAVVYFWSETCPPCAAVQKPALEQLQFELGVDNVQVVAINALDEPEIAAGWGVLGLPTTFIVDNLGKVRRVNHGIARAEQLKEQIREFSSVLS